MGRGLCRVSDGRYAPFGSWNVEPRLQRQHQQRAEHLNVDGSQRLIGDGVEEEEGTQHLAEVEVEVEVDVVICDEVQARLAFLVVV